MRKLLITFILNIALLPAFAAEVDREGYIQFIAEHVDSVNQSILKERSLLLKKHRQWETKKRLSARQKSWLKNLGDKYKVKDFDPEQSEHWNLLLLRVDVIPPSLAIAQSINETGWGRSRFAQQGNNYFGQWCFEKGCGIVPKKRAAKARHEVASYPSAFDSVKSYVLNLNTHMAYYPLRQLRKKLRHADETLSGSALAKGLISYSERGEAYIKEIRAIIKNNDLENFDRELLA